VSHPNTQTTTRPRTRSYPLPWVERPSLEPGDHLSRAEFERRYRLHPEIKKAELVEGVVYMPSPTRFHQHGRPHSDIVTWLGTYRAATPGVLGADNATLRLDFENEVQPDALLRLESKLGGRSRVTEDDYLEGSPELVVEVAASSAAYDLYAKRRVYARTGVQEYLVVQVVDRRVDWFVLREGVYETLVPDENGILRSEVFPGLALQPEAFLSGDLATVLEVLQQELAKSEHGEWTNR